MIKHLQVCNHCSKTKLFPEKLYLVSELFYLYNCSCVEFSLQTYIPPLYNSGSQMFSLLNLLFASKLFILYLFFGQCGCFLELTTLHLLHRYQFPFAPPVHTPVSVHQVPDFQLKDSLTSEPAVSRLRVAWNLGWHENIENLSRVKGVADKRQSDRNVG